MTSHAQRRNIDFLRGLARAFAGAIIFALPLLMTMEMWFLGFSMDTWRLALFLVLFFPVLVALSWHIGFEDTFSWRDDVVDALVAYAVGFCSAGLILLVLGVLDSTDSPREIVGKVSLQAVPASIGALLAQTQFGEEQAESAARRQGPRYASELFIMGVGALFLAFNLAPTEEMLALAFRMTQVHALVLVALSLALMHAFVYGVAFHGRPGGHERTPAWNLFLRFTIAGYAIALLLGAYILWSFGRLDGVSLLVAVKAVTVVGFPAGIGAAAARLIL
ncbi:MAG: TIGR02587 family membrane protein [Ramlibacter sp.]